MIKLNKTILFKILVVSGIFIFQINNIYSQNSILVHKKHAKSYYFLHINNKIKVITTKDTIKGQITQIKDSTFIVTSERRSLEVPLSKIKYIFSYRNNLIRFFVGGALIVVSVIATLGVITFFIFYGGEILSDPVYLGMLLGDIAVSGLASYVILHMVKDNIERDFDLYIVK